MAVLTKEQERKVFLAREFEQGIDSDEILGYHGTSLETLQYVVEHGVLPGYGVTDDSNIVLLHDLQVGDLYFYPIKSKHFDHSRARSVEGGDIVYNDVKSYADVNSQRHALLHILGLSHTKENEYAATILTTGEGSPDEDEMREHLTLQGIDRKTIDDAVERAIQRKGVVIGLSPALLGEYELTNGDPDYCDLRFRCPEGMPYEFIKGIEPLGQEEWDYLIDMQKQVDGE